MRIWKQICTATIAPILLFHAPLLLGCQLQTPRSAVERAVQVTAADVRSAVFSGFVGGGVVSRIERQAVGNSANQRCHV
jgi:hypothetical protein